jgi:RNA polymerase sigma-70 factor (ECF subfamily)
MENILKLALTIGQSVSEFARQLSPLAIPSDTQLVQRVQQGESQAFGELVKRYQSFVFRQAYAYLRDNESAKDAAQEVFVKAYEGLPYLSNTLIFKSWLYQICKNHCLNLLRRKKIEYEYELNANSNNSQNDIALENLLQRLIDSLEEDYREVIILRYYQQLKYEEIAVILGIPQSSVKIRLFRARKALKTMIGNKADDLR